MRSNTKLARDPFTFSLRGIGAVNSHFSVPAVADDAINRVWDARLTQPSRPVQGSNRSGVTHQIETVLARYFAPGCCDAR
ncbi:MAG: hypothetical protein AMJ59_27945 [Gammaproteobacteria bacterium SG8_31]|nr:MAG: hypothetical protein AMJ59_27945 [Gammaproteobacteria bacterium SG8_31]